MMVPYSLVRFVVAPATLHALLSGHPERRRALHDVTWGSDETDAGEVLVTPPLDPDEARAVREAFAGAEGVTEVDASGAYTFGFTTAPESYDGIGTLGLAADERLVGGRLVGERLVAIPSGHLNWQVGRYASGLHRFRPAPPPAAVPVATPQTPAGSGALTPSTASPMAS